MQVLEYIAVGLAVIASLVYAVFRIYKAFRGCSQGKSGCEGCPLHPGGRGCGSLRK